MGGPDFFFLVSFVAGAGSFFCKRLSRLLEPFFFLEAALDFVDFDLPSVSGKL
jgi:hypothetical protein